MSELLCNGKHFVQPNAPLGITFPDEGIATSLTERAFSAKRLDPSVGHVHSFNEAQPALK